jgi:hypothetical protein
VPSVFPEGEIYLCWVGSDPLKRKLLQQIRPTC